MKLEVKFVSKIWSWHFKTEAELRNAELPAKASSKAKRTKRRPLAALFFSLSYQPEND